jgi:hypothetical protein
MTDLSTRASDAEREVVVERLRHGAGEGRLDPDELERRVSAAYSATTRADLAAVVADLPTPPPPKPARVEGEEVRRRVAAFLVPNVICLIVWAATGADYFWPVWVLMGTGIGLAAWLIPRLLGVDVCEDEHDGDRAHRAGLPPPPPLR